jgi:hypothetical protein
MSGISKKLIGTTAAAGDEAIEDVFSTYLYTGNGSTQTITNDIDLAGEGGLVWMHARSTAAGNRLVDSENGNNYLRTHNTSGLTGIGTPAFSLNSDGFTVPNGATAWNGIGDDIVSWTFRKARRFFDVVTYTGDGVAGRTVSHNLGATVGSIIIKRTDTASNWAVYHRGDTAAPETDFLSLNETDATADDTTYWNDTAPTDSVFTVGTNAAVNATGGTYVAYLFAHDPLGPSGDGSDGLIACGSYTGDGTTDGSNVVDVGFEPQWLMVKASSTTGNWYLLDTMRGLTAVGADGGRDLAANSPGAEGSPSGKFYVTQNGFAAAADVGPVNQSGQDYIYIAIRRGPMRVPESGTDVFAIDTKGTGTMPPQYHSGFPVDFAFYKLTTGSGAYTGTRLTPGEYLRLDQQSAATSASNRVFDYQDGWFDASQGLDATYSWMFRRAPNFFDVVAYEGNGSGGTEVLHNLGVAPELAIIKCRTDSLPGGTPANWAVYHKDFGADSNNYLFLNKNNAVDNFFNIWQGGNLIDNMGDSYFELGNDDAVNRTGFGYIAYLFASLDGVSKVGSYTGNGTSQTIDCGFTSGARFVLIKRTDANSDWYLFDTERGITVSESPTLELNNTQEESPENFINPDVSGFTVDTDFSELNGSGGNYIFLAIA